MKKLYLIIAITALITTNAICKTSDKPFNIYVGGGLTLLSTQGSYNDNFKTGYHLSGGFGYKAKSIFEIAIGLDYHSLPNENVDDRDVSFIMVGPDGKFNLGTSSAKINPFLQVGIGLAVKSQSDLTNTMYESNFYFQIGGGIEFKKFFFKIRRISIPDGYGLEPAMIPITIGIKF